MKCPLFEAAPIWPWVEGGPPMLYAAVAVERAMKVQEVICRVLAGTLTWLQGADILGIHTRSLRRWRARYERDGVLGLHDGRRGQPSRRKAPVAEVQRILRLYRERYGPRDGHPGFNVRHFYDLCLLYTSDAADERSSVDLGGRRIIKKK